MKKCSFCALVTLVFFLEVAADRDMPTTPECMTCLCEASSSCNSSGDCEGRFCGLFKLFWEYWIDAGAPTVRGQSFQEPTAFLNCGRDTHCSMLTIQQYMKTFQQDCNGDGKIDCDDFALMHKFGGYGKCKGATLPAIYEAKYLRCKRIVGA